MMATWPLARAVARAGQLGVVSGTLLPVITARRLQRGDPGGHLRRAFEHFPYPGVARRVWDDFYVPGGKPPQVPFDPIRQPVRGAGPALTELLVVAGFAELFLAREGHAGRVAMHHHGQAQTALLPSLYGALLAAPSHLILSGANTAAVLDSIVRLCRGEDGALELAVSSGTPGEPVPCCFDPRLLVGGTPPALPLPRILVTVNSAAEAAALLARAGDRVTGFLLVNASPGGFSETSEVGSMRALGRPFWLAGLPARAENLAAALRCGATGVVVSTPFYYCAESELDTDVKERVVRGIGEAPARLDVTFLSSPTGFSVPVVPLEGTAAHPAGFAARTRFCDVGFLRQLYLKPDGGMGYRCPGEPLPGYVEKGGDARQAVQQHCLCNAVLASLGLGQRRLEEALERPLAPAGEELEALAQFVAPGRNQFEAADVVATLLASRPEALRRPAAG